MTTRVMGHLLPEAMNSLIARDEWESLRHSPGFLSLCDRYGTGHDPKLYSLELMESETRHLCDTAQPLVLEFFLGAADTDAAPGDIDPNRCVLFADLGQGADQPLALDYRCDPPRVLTLEVRPGRGNNRWVTIAADFGAFCDSLPVPGL